jgi:hypothetical protein
VRTLGNRRQKAAAGVVSGAVLIGFLVGRGVYLGGFAVFSPESAEVFDDFIYVGVVEADGLDIGRMVAVVVGREVIDRRVGDGVFAGLIALEQR